ncbi:frequency clock protein-like protein [Ophiocordyceps sinensis CO18]|uniref:Frequency clock protein-like protein n=1 Tax=Ophiocordyceps sinensis (strain Co18 / CGMCC 3.14243) TaxID=911162 RepID=T5A8L8_OPHSC|nr:frequency clock protein-like protein [Ophiocordyceps sinensis CO18]
MTTGNQMQTNELIMSMPYLSSHGTQPPPQSSATGHPLPRRTSAANSVTLRPHRLAPDASLRSSPGSGAANSSNATYSSRRNSGESYKTSRSDPKKWFDQSNQNPTATFDNNVMEVDPPFFQKEFDSSNEEKPFPNQHYAVPPRLATAQSSSGDDYRSVIDDLTVEIQKLKEELKRYKQKGPDMLRKDKLFEIKIHGLPKRKRRELETTLRDFTASLQDSPDASSSQRDKKSSRHATRDHMYSSSYGSNARPVDSAYASMSTGANSSGTSLCRPAMSSTGPSSDLKVQNYLREIPEGLHPRHMAMTERDKKKLVVRRLEQLFTGKIGGRNARRNQYATPAASTDALGPVVPEGQHLSHQHIHQPPTLATAHHEPAREARILPLERPSAPPAKKPQDKNHVTASNSSGNQTEPGGNGNSSGPGTNTSPPSMPPPPEQRPTRVKDLDPDRIQVPSENMEYIRHLGLVPPELLVDAPKPAPDVHPDAEGWVYLNLLCSLAQLHIINVTPGFVRSAVSEISTKFQLSPDGRKIRWRGGSEGTKFSGDSSGDTSQRSPDTDDTSSNTEVSRKRQKTGNSTGDGMQSGDGSSKPHKFGPQVSGSCESFHYKPLFVQLEPPNGQTTMDDTLSSFGPVEDSNAGASRRELSGSGTSNRRKRRHDGAIIYYSGAPFCTDLSGDCGDMSPATYMLSNGQDRKESPWQFVRPLPRRTESGSSLCYRPLHDGPMSRANTKVDNLEAAPRLTSDSDSSADDVELDLSWSGEQQYMEVRPLEPCGLGGVLPDDHFMVVVSTKRAGKDVVVSTGGPTAGLAADCIVNSLATMPMPSSAVPLTSTWLSKCPSNPLEIEYVSGRIKRLAPVSLPPPAIFFPPFSTDCSSDGESDAGFDVDEDEYETSECTSRQANPHHSDGYPDGVDLSSGDEDGEDPDNESDTRLMYDVEEGKGDGRGPEDARRSIGSAEVAPGTLRGRSKSIASGILARTGGSSAATAGGVGSGYSSSVEAST